MPKKALKQQTNFRLEVSLIKRIDAHARRLSASMPGVSFTRVDALRDLLETGFSVAESTSSTRQANRGGDLVVRGGLEGRYRLVPFQETAQLPDTLDEPKTTDYCMRCGESPASASHWVGPSQHAYEDPRK